jgi:hypothetical protein
MAHATRRAGRLLLARAVDACGGTRSSQALRGAAIAAPTAGASDSLVSELRRGRHVITFRHAAIDFSITTRRVPARMGSARLDVRQRARQLYQ